MSVQAYIEDKYKGIVLRCEALDNIVELISDEKDFSLKWKSKIDEFILNSDLRLIATSNLVALNESKEIICKDLIFMIINIRDCTLPKYFDFSDLDPYEIDKNDTVNNEYELKSGPKTTTHNKGRIRTLHLTLTNGLTSSKSDMIISAIEYERVDALSCDLMPGTKILLYGESDTRSNSVARYSENKTLKMQNGILLLKPCNVKVIGGTVNSLIESWKTNMLLASYRTKNSIVTSRNIDSKPPKFTPYTDDMKKLQKLLNEAKVAQEVYKKSKYTQHDNKVKEARFNIEDFHKKVINNNVIDEDEQSKKIHSPNKTINSNNVKKADNTIIRNNTNKSITVDKFRLSTKKNKDKKSDLLKSKKDNKNIYDDDPGAPVRFNRSKEKIDLEARKFIKSAKTSVSLADHLFAKLNIDVKQTSEITKLQDPINIKNIEFERSTDKKAGKRIIQRTK
ncbi:hypothetical protein cand_002980 [Cryptosporidium andersoni]|uniref:Uncharacterized protein n=1 Tax=Cryptosporidium andersoni TaxID=117008 RepID=A0A1J4MHH5_9CRYT|nr:hypothetical protein cand_002980 [Cryptosporidium andersoni]